MGIYGFLSAAYQDTANKEGNVEAQIVLIETKRDNVKEQLEVYTEEKTSINEAVAELRKGLSNNKIQWRDKETNQIITSTSSRTRKALEKQLDQAIERQTEVNTKVDELNEKIFNFETEIVEARIGDGSTSELGPLKYLSGLTGLPMDKIINYLLLTIIFVFDPLAIALVIAANFAFARLRKPTRENLYGETIECSVPEGREFNTPYDLDDLIPDTPYAKEEVSEVLKNEVEKIEKEPPVDFDDDSQTIKDNSKQIQQLEFQKQKIQRNDSTGRRTSEALANINKQIQKLRDEDNTITY
jgi:predicted  nucleic acid-binding Zn-ribbon protein